MCGLSADTCSSTRLAASVRANANVCDDCLMVGTDAGKFMPSGVDRSKELAVDDDEDEAAPSDGASVCTVS